MIEHITFFTLSASIGGVEWVAVYFLPLTGRLSGRLIVIFCVASARNFLIRGRGAMNKSEILVWARLGRN